MKDSLVNIRTLLFWHRLASQAEFISAHIQSHTKYRIILILAPRVGFELSRILDRKGVAESVE